VAVALGVLTLLLAIVDVPLEAKIHTLAALTYVGLGTVLPFAAVGVVIARRQPHSPMGWLLLLIALVQMLAGVGSDYAVFIYRHRAWPFGPLRCCSMSCLSGP
jgi:hypothetical protein